MRPVLVSDLICAARAVLTVPDQARAYHARLLLDMADQGDQHRIVHHTRHAALGDGTLSDAARCLGMGPEPSVCRPDFAAALIEVLQAVLERANANDPDET